MIPSILRPWKTQTWTCELSINAWQEMRGWTRFKVHRRRWNLMEKLSKVITFGVLKFQVQIEFTYDYSLPVYPHIHPHSMVILNKSEWMKGFQFRFLLWVKYIVNPNLKKKVLTLIWANWFKKIICYSIYSSLLGHH